MNNNINIAEILKDCPERMKPYSPLFGKVELVKNGSDNIYVFLIMMKDLTFLILLRKMDIIPDIRKQNVFCFPPQKCATGRSFLSEGTW